MLQRRGMSFASPEVRRDPFPTLLLTAGNETTIELASQDPLPPSAGGVMVHGVDRLPVRITAETGRGVGRPGD